MLILPKTTKRLPGVLERVVLGGLCRRGWILKPLGSLSGHPFFDRKGLRVSPFFMGFIIIQKESTRGKWWFGKVLFRFKYVYIYIYILDMICMTTLPIPVKFYERKKSWYILPHSASSKTPTIYLKMVGFAWDSTSWWCGGLHRRPIQVSRSSKHETHWELEKIL